MVSKVTKPKETPEDSSSITQRIIAEIKSDKRYLRTIELVDSLLGDVDIEVLHDEVLGYQEKRGNRPPLALVKRPNKYLVRYASEDASLRSRISFIQSTCRRVSNKINYLLTAFNDWVMASYGSQLKGTVQIKNAIVSDLSFTMRGKVATLDSLDECCAIALEDIDQGQWQRKAIISVLDIEARPEGKL